MAESEGGSESSRLGKIESALFRMESKLQELEDSGQRERRWSKSKNKGSPIDVVLGAQW